MSVEITRLNRAYSEPSPQQTRLPPLSSILNRSPNTTTTSEDHQTHKLPQLFSQTNDTSTPSKKFTLPSIENLTSSPGFKRSNSFPQTTLPLFQTSQLPDLSNTSSNSLVTSSKTVNTSVTTNSSFVPVTPVYRHMLPPPPMFSHSTPSMAPPPQLQFLQQPQQPQQPQQQQQKYEKQPLYLPQKQQPQAHQQLQQHQEQQQLQIKEESDPNTSHNSGLETPQSKKRSASFQNSSPQSENKSFAFISHSQATFLSAEPDIDNARLARRKRRRTSPHELAILQEEFEKGNTPNKSRRLDIASKVDMTEKAVQIWFQNKRQSLRKTNQSIKEVVLNVPGRHDLDQQLLSAEELEESMISNSTANSTISPIKQESILSDDNDEAVLEDDDDETNSTTADNSRNSSLSPSLKSSPTSQHADITLNPIHQHQYQQQQQEERITDSLPPTGVFTPMKTPNSSQQQKKNLLTTTPLQNHHQSMTFKFKTTDNGLLTPIQSSSSKTQKPTMKLSVNNNSNSNAKDSFHVFRDTNRLDSRNNISDNSILKRRNTNTDNGTVLGSKNVLKTRGNTMGKNGGIVVMNLKKEQKEKEKAMSLSLKRKVKNVLYVGSENKENIPTFSKQQQQQQQTNAGASGNGGDEIECVNNLLSMRRRCN